MFSCSACLRTLISSLVTGTPIVSATPFTRAPQALSRPRNLRRPNDPSIRTSATVRGLSKRHHRREALNVLRSDSRIEALKGNKKRNATKGSPSYEDAKQANARQSLTAEGKSKLERQVEKEAVFLVDPLRLANTVVQLLRDENWEKAHALILASDRQGMKMGTPQGSVNNIVSWNHLMDWLMAKHQPKEAMSLFQDMKKRGHKPDSYTYTTLLRGLAENHTRLGGKAAEMAVKIYNSIFLPNSIVKVSKIHTNAVLMVCARANDMDSLWSVAGRMPERGRGSADHWTYTTVLNAMRNDMSQAISVNGKENEAGHMDKSMILRKSTTDARALWRDVVVKWRNADLEIDERLVSSMGRLLLLSKSRTDLLDVFALIRQTMGVHVDHQSLEEVRKSSQEDNADPETEAEEGEELQLTDGNEPASDQSPYEEVNAFEPIPVKDNAASRGSNAPSRNAVYAQPGRNTLSMLLEAATKLNQAHIGKAYWHLLTDEGGAYQIKPDAGNCIEYMRLLRQSRSPRAALEMLQRDWPPETGKFMKRRGAFVVAMSTCVRNKQNPNAFSIASRMLDIMQEKASESRDQSEEHELEMEESEEGRRSSRNRVRVEALDMDAKVLTMYLELAMHTTRGVNPRLPLSKMRNGDLDYERDPSSNNTMKALRRLGPDVVNVLRMVKLVQAEATYKSRLDTLPASARRKMPAATRTGDKVEDLLGFLRTVVSACDRVLAVNFRLEDEGAEPLDRGIIREVKIRKAKMASYIEALSKSMGLQVEKPSTNHDTAGPRMEAVGMEDDVDGHEPRADGKPESPDGVQEGQFSISRPTTRPAELRERPLSRRQRQEKERERRAAKMGQIMVRTGRSEEEIREHRREKARRHARSAHLGDHDLWGREAADTFNSFTELRS